MMLLVFPVLALVRTEVSADAVAATETAVTNFAAMQDFNNMCVCDFEFTGSPKHYYHVGVLRSQMRRGYKGCSRSSDIAVPGAHCPHCPGRSQDGCTSKRRVFNGKCIKKEVWSVAPQWGTDYLLIDTTGDGVGESKVKCNACRRSFMDEFTGGCLLENEDTPAGKPPQQAGMTPENEKDDTEQVEPEDSTVAPPLSEEECAANSDEEETYSCTAAGGECMSDKGDSVGKCA